MPVHSVKVVDAGGLVPLDERAYLEVVETRDIDETGSGLSGEDAAAALAAEEPDAGEQVPLPE